MAGPLYPGYQADLGFDDLTLTLVYATYAAASVPALLLLGPLADRCGRVRLVRAGLLLAAAGSLCFALGDHVAWLVAGRVLQGAALGAATGAGMAVLAATHPTARARRLAGSGAVVFLAGTAAGPGLTGLLADLVPAPLATVHVLHALALVAVHHRLGPSTAVAGPPGRRRRAVPQLPPHGRGPFLAATATGFVSWAVVGLFLGLVPSALARDGSGAGVTALGAVASVVVLAALPVQALLPRRGAGRAQLAGLALLALGLVGWTATGAAASLPVTLATAVVAGVGHGLAYGGAHGVVVRTAVGARAAGTTATAYVVYYAGAGIPTVAVGLLSATMPLAAATRLLAAVLVGAALAAAVAVGGRTGRVRPVDDDTAPVDLVDLARGALWGLHQANGIRHGVRRRAHPVTVGVRSPGRRRWPGPRPAPPRSAASPRAGRPAG